MSNFIGGARLPTVTKEFVEAIDNAFDKPDIIPGATMDRLMYQAGQRSVIEWIKKHTSMNASTGDQAQLAEVRLGR